PEQLAPVVQAAVAQWEAAGLSAEQVQRVRAAEVRIADLPAGVLGQASAAEVVIDVDAAGYGWFVDATPWTHEEFQAETATRLTAAPSSAAAAGVDLLTVLLHELGHVAGLGHAEDDEALMASQLTLGERRLPEPAALVGEGEADPLATLPPWLRTVAEDVARRTTKLTAPAPTSAPSLLSDDSTPATQAAEEDAHDALFRRYADLLDDDQDSLEL